MGMFLTMNRDLDLASNDKHWQTMGEIMARANTSYDSRDVEFYMDKATDKKIVIAFTDYVQDPLHTLTRIYQHIGHDDIPASARAIFESDKEKESHASRGKVTYKVNRSLNAIGIDEEKVMASAAHKIYTERFIRANTVLQATP